VTEYLVFTNPMVSENVCNIYAQYDPFCEVVDATLVFTERRDLILKNGEDFSPFFENKSH
jgi:hypothetical protein